MEYILNDSVDRLVFFIARDVTNLFTRETGLSSFTVNYVLDNGARGVMTTPTTAEIDATNLPGLYSLAIDEAAMTNMDAANDFETLTLHITHASIDPVTMKVGVYRAKITTARTLGIDAGGALSVCTLNTDMVGTDNAALASVLGAAVGASISVDIAAVKAETVLIVGDTGELQTNQGAWATATGFATPTNITAGTITTVTTVTNVTNIAGVAASTQIQSDVVAGLETYGANTVTPEAVGVVTTAITAAHLATDTDIGNLNDFDPDNDDIAVVISSHSTTDALISSSGIGDGSITVNHDTGGTDNLTYKVSGAGVDNATVRAYLKTDYDAGNLSSLFIKGTTRTDTFGRWENDLMLDPAVYTIYFFKQGIYGPDTKEITIS